MRRGVVDEGGGAGVNRIAIDPGEVHVGLCWDFDGEVRTMELKPDVFVKWFPAAVEDALRVGPLEVVVESFKLYPGQTRKTPYRTMATSELIGKIELLCGQQRVPMVKQDATIKKPTRRQLRARGIKQVGRNTHERDAELHYWYRRLRGEAA